MWISQHEQADLQEQPAATEDLVSLETQDYQRERQGTYIVQDLSNREELTRLTLQDELLTRGMGGVLPEQQNLDGIRRVLDTGCGTGGWLLEVARTYPACSLLIGIDLSRAMITSARARVASDPQGARVRYHVMDSLDMHQFPQGCFDLVNQRLGTTYLRTWDWPRLFAEYRRVTRSGGIVRISECGIPESNSPALNQLNQLFLRALVQAGHLFTPEKQTGLLDELVSLCTKQRLQHVQKRLHRLEYQAGTADGEDFIANQKHLFRTLLPFLRKWSHVPENYKELYRQALHEMRSADFVATWNVLTVWGQNP
jgi:ubiquinone/menaquinone biosynthesis C-methylase UbiE